jgi:chaperonin GroES
LCLVKHSWGRFSSAGFLHVFEKDYANQKEMSGLNIARRLKPLFDRVLVQRVEAVKKIGSVYIPDSAMEKINEGVVIAVGPGARNQAGETIKMTVKEGDKVLLPEYGGDKIELDKQEYTIFREAELLGVLADK